MSISSIIISKKLNILKSALASLNIDLDKENRLHTAKYDSKYNEQILNLDEEIFGDRDSNIFNKAEGFVILDGGRLIGYVLYQIEDDNLHIRSLGVQPDSQGMGLGKALLKEVIKIIDFNGYTSSLSIDPNFNIKSNAPEKLRNLYRRFNFNDSGKRNIIENEIWVRPKIKKV
jgi:ribosomal protein S18 acetylase RimI-like enzyme